MNLTIHAAVPTVDVVKQLQSVWRMAIGVIPVM
jgi:hypothetical protein